jgi:beta-galactosidase
MNTVSIPYEPGELEVIGYKGEREVSRFRTETTGAPSRLQLIPDREALAGDGLDAMPVTVQALDAKGRPVPTANLPVTFEISGPGRIIGLGNGDPNSHEPEKGTKRSLFNGLAQVIIQSEADSPGIITLTAKSDELKPATVTIIVKKAEQPASVPVAHPVIVLSSWRISPFTPVRPDPNQKVAANDQNSWAPARTGQLQDFTGGKFAVYRTRFKPYIEQQNKGAKMILENVTGKAEVWIDNQLTATKNNFDPADLDVLIPAKEGTREINVLIEAEPGKLAGINGAVTVPGYAQQDNKPR